MQNNTAKSSTAQMKNRTQKALSTVILLMFVFSITPISGTIRNDTNDLRSVIMSIQLLQQTNQPIKASFQTAFADTITALRTAAGFTTMFIALNAQQDSDSAQIVVSVRLPCLLPPSAGIAPVFPTQKLPPDTYQFVALTSYPAPETPPPLFS